MRRDTPRIPPVDLSSVDDETRELLARQGDSPDNVFTTIANHPKLMKRWMVFATHVLAKSTVPARERELVILAVGWRCQAGYEWGQHVRIGTAAGLSAEEIARIPEGPSDPAWSEGDRVLLQMVDELHDTYDITDATWAALSERWSTEQLIDLIFATGQYHLVSMFLNATGVQLDDGLEGLPTRP